MTPAAEFRSGPVEYTLGDFRELARLTTPMILRAARIFGWVLLVLATFTFAASRLLGTPYRPVDFLYGALVALALVVLGSPTQRAWRWRWQMGRNPLYAPQSFTIRNGGLDVASSRVRSEISWTAFDRLVRAEGCLFLFLPNNSAYMVPRRAFDSDAEFQAFSNQAFAKWENRDRP